MAPNQGNDGTAAFGGRVPVNIKTAAKDWANELDYQNRQQNIGESHLYRQALYELFLNKWDELPEGVRDEVDREWLQSRVNGGLGVNL